MTTLSQKNLISHSIINNEPIAKTVTKIASRIQATGEKNDASIAYQLDLLEQLAQFELGRFLLQNQGANGYWTNYVVTYPWFKNKTSDTDATKPSTELESFLLNKSPIFLATQQRFQIFLTENQTQVKDGANLASLPCGLLGDLLYLNFSGKKNFVLTGIDYDPDTLKDAKILAKETALSEHIHLIQQDAWQLNIQNQFDLISSNGLTIYEADDKKVTALYRILYKALRPQGKLVTSFITPPPPLTENCEWDFSQINTDDLALQKILLLDIIQAKWSCFRSTQQTKELLLQAGFKNIRFIYDNAKMFPTVVAYKE